MISHIRFSLTLFTAGSAIAREWDTLLRRQVELEMLVICGLSSFFAAVPTLTLWLEEYPLQSVQFLRPRISLGLSMPLYILEHLAKRPATIVKLRMLCAQFASLDLATLGGCWLRALQELTLDETEGSWNGRVALLGQVALLITPANVPALSLLRLVDFDTVYAEWRDIIALKLCERCHLGTLQTLHIGDATQINTHLRFLSPTVMPPSTIDSSDPMSGYNVNRGWIQDIPDPDPPIPYPFDGGYSLTGLAPR
ncbi:hypothetical protein C8J57DRAFT_1259987, partial [Mycena rebaudengoi]